MADTSQDDLLNQYYSKQLTPIKPSPFKPLTLHTPPSQQFFDLNNSQQHGYQQGKPFKIEVQAKQSYADLKDQSYIKKFESGPSESFEQFSELHVGLQEISGEGHQVVDEGEEIQEESKVTVVKQVVVKESNEKEEKSKAVLHYQPHNKTKPSAKSNPKPKSRTPGKRTYTKVPFFGLFFKRRFNSPRSSSQKSPEQQSTSKPTLGKSVSNMLVKQILESQNTWIQQLQTQQILHLNSMLLQRLHKYKLHYKQLQKQKYYILMNDLMQKHSQNKRILDDQRRIISQLQDTKTRQSSQYSKALEQVTKVLKDNVHTMGLSVRNLRSGVKIEPKQEKVEHSAEQVKQRMAYCEWECERMVKKLEGNERRDGELRAQVEDWEKRVGELGGSLKELQERAREMINQYYLTHPNKQRKVSTLSTMIPTKTKSASKDTLPVNKSSSYSLPRRSNLTPKRIAQINHQIKQVKQTARKLHNLSHETILQKLEIGINPEKQTQIQSKVENPEFSEEFVVLESSPLSSEPEISVGLKALNKEQSEAKSEVTGEDSQIEISPVKDHVQGIMLKPTFKKKDKPQNPQTYTFLTSPTNRVQNIKRRLLSKKGIDRYHSQPSDQTSFGHSQGILQSRLRLINSTQIESIPEEPEMASQGSNTQPSKDTMSMGRLLKPEWFQTQATVL